MRQLYRWKVNGGLRALRGGGLSNPRQSLEPVIEKAAQRRRVAFLFCCNPFLLEVEQAVCAPSG